MEEFQERFDELIGRIENGERLGIIDEDGRAAVMMPEDDDFVRMYTEYNNEAQ